MREKAKGRIPRAPGLGKVAGLNPYLVTCVHKSKVFWYRSLFSIECFGTSLNRHYRLAKFVSFPSFVPSFYYLVII